MIPSWVRGGATGDGSTRKYNRAKEELRKQGVANPTEEQLKELYIKYGGAIEETDTVESSETEAKPKGRPKKA